MYTVDIYLHIYAGSTQERPQCATVYTIRMQTRTQIQRYNNTAGGRGCAIQSDTTPYMHVLSDNGVRVSDFVVVVFLFLVVVNALGWDVSRGAGQFLGLRPGIPVEGVVDQARLGEAPTLATAAPESPTDIHTHSEACSY